jgi:hypothetical protein
VSEVEDLLQDPGVSWSKTKNADRFVLSTFGRDGLGNQSRGRVLGDITVERTSDGSFKILPDFYNFEQHENPNNNFKTNVRNVITANAKQNLGDGKSFWIEFTGSFRPKIPVEKLVRL